MSLFNVGLIGHGYWGKNLLRNLRESMFVSQIHVADIDPKVIARLNTTERSIHTTTRADELLVSEDIDVVFIATPGSLHFEMAQQALSSGKHVFVEKPVVTRSVEAEHLQDMAKKSGLTIAVDHTFLYNEAVQKIKGLISANQFGKLNYIDCTRINLGIYQQDVNVMWDLAAHDISMINYWTNERPTTVRAIGKVNKRHEVLDLAYIFLTYSSGLLVQINCSWASPVKIRKTIIGGSQRMIIYDDVEPTEKLKIYDYRNVENDKSNPKKVLVDYRLGDVSIPKLSLTEPLQSAVTDFFESIIEKRSPLSNIQTGIDVVKVLECADLSLKQNGKPITLL
ncbi:MAG: putative dehydrogenase [Bacteroidia bacterium]|jgi:predicted dehydrogenase